MMYDDHGLDALLDLDGTILEIGNGLWVKIEARRSTVTEHRPHGIRYSLTLHDPLGKRLMGYDNAHGQSGWGTRYDHKHTKGRILRYDYESAEKLMIDFWAAVDELVRGDL